MLRTLVGVGIGGVAALLVWVVTAGAQPPAGAEGGQTPAGSKVSQTLLFEVTEILADRDDQATLLKTSDLGKSLEELSANGKLKRSERIVLTTLENQSSMAQFGRRVPVVIGESQSSLGTRSRQVREESEGSLLRVTARVEGDVVLAELQYESSRRAESASDALPGPMETFVVQTTVSVPLGGTALVAGSAAGQQRLLMVGARPLGSAVSGPATSAASAARPAFGGRAASGRGGFGGTASGGRDGFGGFSRGRRGAAGDRPAAEDPRDRFATAMFERMDSNQDGSLERDELRPSTLQARFDEADADDNGKLSLPEFKELVGKPPTPTPSGRQ